jgi:hypothetical protein
MRIAIGLLASLTVVASASLLAPPSVPQTKLSVTDLYAHSFEIDFPYDQKIRLDLRSGAFRIVGTGNHKLSVRAGGKNADKAKDLTLNFKHFGNHADLRVLGGSTRGGDVEITIEVPKASDLYVRMPFGDLTVEGVSGDKDVELHAGDLVISVGEAADYGHVDASVGAGDLSAGPFGESKDGLFRSFEKTGTGRYKLHAHVGAGDLILR